jgi:hypothetical protein
MWARHWVGVVTVLWVMHSGHGSSFAWLLLSWTPVWWVLWLVPAGWYYNERTNISLVLWDSSTRGFKVPKV